MLSSAPARTLHPFNTGYLPLNYSGKPGVNMSYREGYDAPAGNNGNRPMIVRTARGDMLPAPSVPRLYPFNAGYLPLNYSGNPGVNGVSYRGVNAKRWAYSISAR